jgi:hypothetical protein
VELIALAIGFSVLGSLNSCSAPTSEKTVTSVSVGASSGSLIFSAICSSRAPSSSAASYSSRGSARSEV